MVVLDVFLDDGLEENHAKLAKASAQLLKLLDLRQHLRALAVRVASVLHRVHRPSSSDIDNHQRHYRRIHLSGRKKHCFNPLKTYWEKDVMNSWKSHKSISSKEKERRLTFIMVPGIGLTRKETINKEWTSKDERKKGRLGYKIKEKEKMGNPTECKRKSEP